MRNAIYSLILSTIFAPALLLIVPPSEVPAKNESDWPVIVQDDAFAEELVAVPQGELPAPGSSLEDQIQGLEKLAQEIRVIASKVQEDADKARLAAEEAGKNVEGMKSYVPPSDVQPLTEARVIELIDQRIRELNIECKCVTTGQTVKRSVPVKIDSRGVAAFDLQPNEVVTGYQDVVTGKWVSVDRSAMQVKQVPSTRTAVNVYESNGTEYREIQPTSSQVKRGAVRFNFGAPSVCRVQTVNGVRKVVCSQQP